MPEPNRDALVLLVMGVSGSGKSTVAGLVAHRLGWAFADGDDFHSAENKARMHAGEPLSDAERAPWLDRIAAWIDARLRASESGVVACSALKRAYRDRLVRAGRGVRIVYLEGSRERIADRLARRRGHFMPAHLLDTQFAVLEPPTADEDPIVVGIAEGPEAIAAAIASRLGHSQET